MIKTLRYSNFWPNFDPEDFIITKILRKSLQQNITIIRNPYVEVDLEVDSVFQFKNSIDKFKQYSFAKSNYKAQEYLSKNAYGYRSRDSIRAKKAIWYTAENLRPPYKVYDATFSFDTNCEIINNGYLPYWMTLLNWKIDSGFLPKFASNEFIDSRKGEIRPRIACSFSSSQEPNRSKVSGVVSEVMPVEFFGKAHNRYVRNKHATSLEFGYQICTENDLYPGYVTEKLFESWTSQNIPIWSGLLIDDLINEKAMINLAGLSHNQMHAKLRLDKDYELQLRANPLLKNSPNLDHIVKLLAKVIE